MNEAIENVVRENDDETLRVSRTEVRPFCKDREGVKELSDSPVPKCVPGDFTVVIGDVMPAYVMKELREEFAKYGGAAQAISGFLSAIHWVELEVQGFPDLLEGLARLKGALMAVGAAVEGEW